MFSLIYAWINDWVNNREAGDLRRQHGHYDVIVMWYSIMKFEYKVFIQGNAFENAIADLLAPLNSLRPIDAYMRQ